MATYKWSIPTGKQIDGQTYIKDTDNKIYDTIADLVDFVNSEGTHTGAGLVYDLVDKTSAQTITGAKVFNNATITGSLTGNVVGNVTGNSSTATTLSNSRTISLTGDATGSTTFNGSSDATISVTVVDDSHNHSNLIPSGCIVMWSGSIASIPSGWYLCNGANGTPNLIDRFIVGAGSSYGVSSTGGSKDSILVSHTHSFSATTSTSGSHQHTETLGYLGVFGAGSSGASGNYGGAGYGARDLTESAGSHNHTVSGSTDTQGASGTNANLPPYYALAYIMKG